MGKRVIIYKMELGEEDKNSDSTLSQMITAPLEFVRRIIPSHATSEIEEQPVEKVGDKLRKKKLKTKCRSSAIHKRDYSSVCNVKKKQMGSNRSVVRYIGSNVPIASSSRREYLELIDHSRKAFMSHASTFISANIDQMRQRVDHVKYHVVPTLADLGQLVWEDGFDEEEEEEAEQQDEDDHGEQSDVAAESHVLSSSSKINNPGDDKISALEDELAKLRAQIAMIVTAQTGTPTASIAQPTPVAIVAPTTVAPPPPPPPPPMPAALMSTSLSRMQSVQRKKSAEEKNAPAMEDLLKSLSTVKLKTVDISRSPGGTPMKKKTQPRADSTNPADIIARALREKFQNSRLCYDSPEKDSSPQSGFTPSPVKKHKKSPKVHSTMAKPVPRPRPRPKAKVKKRISKSDENITDNKSSDVTNLSFV